MIFVTVGSQKFQFNRLLEKIDQLICDGKINSDDVFAQTGYSTYNPKNFGFKKFLDKEEFTKVIDSSQIVITHGGTGSIISSVKRGKKVIAVPRSVKFGEHVDNHQFELVEQFSDSNMIYAITNIDELENALLKINEIDFRGYTSNTLNVIQLLEDELNSFK